MKKITIFLAMICTLNFSVKAQDESSAVHKGTSLIDVYYGGPNLYGAIFKSLVESAAKSNNNNNGGITNVSGSGSGFIGGKYEYLLTDIFGIGVDFNYSTYTVKFQELTTDNNGTPVIYHYSYTTPAIRAMVGFNFHFVHAANIDVYGAVKTGYYNRTTSFTSDQPGYNFTFTSLIPVAFRLETGMRYFFTPNVGVHANIGIGGGPIAVGGVSLKF
jgi:hypothetical protein